MYKVVLFLSCIGFYPHFINEQNQVKSTNNIKYKCVENIDELFLGCPKNIDTLYNRDTIMQSFVDIIMRQLKDYDKSNYVFGSFIPKVENGIPSMFYVFDMTDTLNYSLEKECVDFLDNHVYHFAPIWGDLTFDNICILENGRVMIFEAINCMMYKQSLEDVLIYLRNKEIPNKEEVLYRLNNYREFGYFSLPDLSYPPCQEYKNVSIKEKERIYWEEKEKQKKEKKGKN